MEGVEAISHVETGGEHGPTFPGSIQEIKRAKSISNLLRVKVKFAGLGHFIDYSFRHQVMTVNHLPSCWVFSPKREHVPALVLPGFPFHHVRQQRFIGYPQGYIRVVNNVMDEALGGDRPSLVE